MKMSRIERIEKMEEDLAILKAEYQKEAQEINEKLYMELVSKLDSTVAIKFRYNGKTLISINHEGFITYRRSTLARQLFAEWVKKGSKVHHSKVIWKDRIYSMTGGASCKLTSTNKKGYGKSPIFMPSECYGNRNCTDSNIMVTPHNWRPVVHY